MAQSLGGIALRSRPKQPPFEENSTQVARSLAALLDRGGQTFYLGHGGPLPGDADEWVSPGGTRLHNTGSWVAEDVFVDTRRGGTGGDGPSNPYWPGRVTLLGDEGPPRHVSAHDTHGG